LLRLAVAGRIIAPWWPTDSIKVFIEISSIVPEWRQAKPVASFTTAKEKHRGLFLLARTSPQSVMHIFNKVDHHNNNNIEKGIFYTGVYEQQDVCMYRCTAGM
jgi:hypothetical protein